MTELVHFCDNKGLKNIRLEVMNFVPRIGECVSFTTKHGQYISSRVVDVSYSIRHSEVRIFICLDVDASDVQEASNVGG